MDVLGDRAAGHAAPVEANEISVVVLGDRRELDPLAGGWVEDGSEPGGGDVLAGGAVQGFGAGHELARFCGVCGVPFRVWYQATVAAMAVARGVPAVVTVDWYLVVSSTNGWSNS